MRRRGVSVFIIGSYTVVAIMKTQTSFALTLTMLCLALSFYKSPHPIVRGHISFIQYSFCCQALALIFLTNLELGVFVFYGDRIILRICSSIMAVV